MAGPEDKPIGGTGADDKVTIRLPRAAKPVSGDFTVMAQEGAPFTKVILAGPRKKELVFKEDGTIEWQIARSWTFSIE